MKFLVFDLDKIFKNKFLRLYFLFGHAFVHIPASTKYSTPRPWSKFSQINSCVKTYAAFRVLFADWTDYLPTTEAFFAFQFNFIIIVFLHCRHEMKYNCCLLFFGFLKLNCLFGFSPRKASHRNGIHRWLRL